MFTFLVALPLILGRDPVEPNRINPVPKRLNMPSLDEAQKMAAIAYDLSDQDRFDESLKLYRKVLEIALHHVGEYNVGTGDTCHMIAWNLRCLNQFAEAETYCKRSIDIFEKLQGPNSPRLAREWIEMFHIHTAAGNEKAAALAFTKAETIYLKVAEKSPVEMAEFHEAMAARYRKLRRDNDVEDSFRKALAVREKHQGPEHLQVIECLDNLALFLAKTGRVAEAEPVFRRLLLVSAKVKGPLSRAMVDLRRDLAECLRELGRFTDAETLDREALQLSRVIFGPNHEETAESIINLASSVRLQGHYAEAELLQRKALRIYTQQFGPKHPDVARCLSNLANVLLVQGQVREAEALARESAELRRQHFGDNHPTTAGGYHNLASILDDVGKWAEAEPFARKAWKIRSKTLGEQHPDTLVSASNLVAVLDNLDRFLEADLLRNEVLQVRLAKLGPFHPDTATSLNASASQWSSRGQFSKAEEKARQAVAIYQKLGSESTPSGLYAQNALAWSLTRQGKFAEALVEAKTATRIFQTLRARVSLSGLKRATFAAGNSPLPLTTALLAHQGKGVEAWQLFEQNLARGLLDDISGRSSRPLTDAERTEEETLQGKLHLIEQKIDQQPTDTLKQELRELLSQWASLQERLLHKHGVAAGEVYDLERIQKSLLPNQAIVGWLDLRDHSKDQGNMPMHWAVVVRSKDAPIWIPLPGSGEKGAWTAMDRQWSERVRGILTNRQTIDEVDWEPPVARLAKLRWNPIEPHLNGVQHLLVVPSPGLAGVPVEVLASKYRVGYVPSGTMLTWLKDRDAIEPTAKTGLFALGDPIFSEDQANNIVASQRDVRDLILKRLPGTRVEVEAIRNLFVSSKQPQDVLLGLDAQRNRLEQLASEDKLGSFRYLHLATHGHPDAVGGMNSYLALTPPDFSMPVAGKLTAEQVRRTWKIRADVVTLSACQTARGEEQGGEGTIGFAQAFILAGARSLVLSLWQVDDTATSLFMVRFYQNLLGQRDGLKSALSASDALAEARSWLRNLTVDEIERFSQQLPGSPRPRLADLDRPYSHPYYWVPFILMGR